MDLGRLEQVFRDVLPVEDDVPVESLRYGTTPGWDSLAHVQLVTELEEAFDVVLEGDDIGDISDVASARDVLTRHAVVFGP